MEILENISFNEPPKGLYQEVIRQIFSDLKIVFSTSVKGNKTVVKVRDLWGTLFWIDPFFDSRLLSVL